MARRRKDRTDDRLELTLKFGIFMLLLVALGIGGMQHFVPALFWLIKWILIVAAVAAVLGVVTVLLVRNYRNGDTTAFMAAPPSTAAGAGPSVPPFTSKPADKKAPAAVPVSTNDGTGDRWNWTSESIRQRLDEIDWYQFEKFCGALLQADGFAVERKGGAHPDGGVDLIVEKTGARALIQCKHWRTWEVKEKTVREMLGSMTHFAVSQVAIYTLKGWTKPAAEFAAQHNITLVNGAELSLSAKFQLSEAQLEEFLRPTTHHCPKCEAPMVWREGDFTPFWGCTRYPKCYGKLNHAGAR